MTATVSRYPRPSPARGPYGDDSELTSGGDRTTELPPILSSVHALRPDLGGYFGTPMDRLRGEFILSAKGQSQSEHDIGEVGNIDSTLATSKLGPFAPEARCGRSIGGGDALGKPLLPTDRHLDDMLGEQPLPTEIPSIKDIISLPVLRRQVGRNKRRSPKNPWAITSISLEDCSTQRIIVV